MKSDPEFDVNLKARTIKHIPTSVFWWWDAVELTIDTEDKANVNFDLTSLDFILPDEIWEELTKRAGKELKTLFLQAIKLCRSQNHECNEPSQA